MGPFEEEEEGTGVASDVVKVEGEDPATPGPQKRNDTRTITIPQYQFNKNKATHTHKRLPVLGSVLAQFLPRFPSQICACMYRLLD